MEEGKVSFVFPTMNRKNEVIEAVKSIKNSSYKNTEIIIGDNGSTDGTVEAIRKKFPDVKVLDNKMNYGSPLAINNCIKEANGEYIFRFEDDMILEKDSLKIMLDLLKSDPKIGLVSAPYFYTEEPDKIRGAGLRVSLFTGMTEIYGKDEGNGERYLNRQFEREAAGGGSHLTRKSTFKEIGLYDELFFLCYEDIDWCYKLRNTGKKIMFTGETKLFHKKETGMSQVTNPFRVYYLFRGQTIFMKKNAGWRLAVYFPFLFLGKIPYWSIKYLFSKRLDLIRAMVSGVFNGLFKNKIFVCTENGKQVPYYRKTKKYLKAP